MEYAFQGSLLKEKVNFSKGNQRTAQQKLLSLLEQVDRDSQRATLHYELWKMSNDNAHKIMALELHRKLYKTTKNRGIKNKIEKLSK